MAQSARLEALNLRHKELDDRLAQEMSRPSTDPIKLTEIKRQKLALKDEMRHLSERPSA